MVRLVVLLILGGAIVLVPSVTNATEVRERRPNLVDGELLGRAPLLSVGYERSLTSQIGVGARVGYLPELPDQATETLSTSLYISVIPFGETHSPYLSTGVRYTSSGVSGGTSLYPFLSGGYQYQSQRGFFLRATVTWIDGSAESALSVRAWGSSAVIPGLALGYSF